MYMHKSAAVSLIHKMKWVFHEVLYHDEDRKKRREEEKIVEIMAITNKNIYFDYWSGLMERGPSQICVAIFYVKCLSQY